MFQVFMLPLFLSCLIVGCAATEYWVSSDSTSHCNTRQPCLTLSEYVQNTSHYFTSNSVLHFLSGNHTISETTQVIVQDVQNISLVGSAGHATVQCNGRLSFTFWEVHNLQISSIGFIGCGLGVTGDLQYHVRTLFGYQFPVKVHVALLFVECSSVVLENVTIMESYGYGLLGYNMITAELNHCLFHRNYWRPQVDSKIQHPSPNLSEYKAGGNAIFILMETSNLVYNSLPSFYTVTLKIFHSEFAHGRNQFKSLNFESALNGGGLGIHIALGNSAVAAVNITVYNCSMYNNTASVGANMFISIYMPLYSYMTVHINNSMFFGGRSTGKGGGFMLQIDRYNFVYSRLSVHLVNSKFYGNLAASGSGLYLSQAFGSHAILQGIFQMTIASTIFQQNFGLVDNNLRKYDCAVLYLSYTNITIVNSTFSDSNCTAIAANSSIFHLQGTVEFYRNTGYSGGALAFYRDAYCQSGPRVRIESSMILTPHTSVYIVNNTAVRYGGGILVDEECTMERYCFFQTGFVNYTQMDARVVMEGNRAGKAGDSIFGGCLHSCNLVTPSISDKVVLAPPKILSLFFQTPLLWAKTILTPEIFSRFFQMVTTTQSELAASPQKVCFCDGDNFEVMAGYNYDCLSEASIAQFRGETFHVPAMIVGDYGYASPALVRTVIAPGDSGQLEGQQSTQDLGNMCENLTYSVRTPQESIKLHLSVESPLENLMHLTRLNISFRPCPLGFNLSETPPKCDCALQLRKPGVKCNINTQLIHRPALVWIGNYSDEVVVHTNCPFDYCKPKDNDISLYEQNQQCAFNRSGVLCGACQPGLSLALGTSRCMECSDIYILLFIPFALAGVALIILMLKCNLTVSTGTLNGLIFYANIVRANHAVFFPLGRSDAFSSFLSVFIAWLNLDLGVEVCLFRGMDTYIRAWLQFLFPIHIWILVGFMICTSRYSTTIARLSGSNTVSVLATLFLLSYAKLLRTTIASISFTTLTDRYGNISAVWLLDGNMPAMKGSHIPLVVMSILALVVYVLPFTTLVLLTPWLQARSGHRLLRWVNKMKPLLDAYQGPYRDKFRYWTGLLLIVRIILFAIFGGNALGDPRINLFAITVVIVTLLVFWLNAGKVHKKLWMKLLESFFLLNLSILAGGTLFLKSLEGFSVVEQQAVLTSIMIGSAFIVFIAILATHCYQELAKKDVIKDLCAKCTAFVTKADRRRGGCENDDEGISDGSTAATSQPPTVTVVAMDEFRESLLTEN